MIQPLLSVETQNLTMIKPPENVFAFGSCSTFFWNMIIFLLFGVISADPITTSSPIHCPDGFSVLNDKTCVKLSITPLLYQDALNSCKNYTGGNLVSVHNAIDNRFLAMLAKDIAHPFWIGLICTASLPGSCDWEDYSGNAGGYNNFASGNPFIDVGSNVYMLTTGNSAGKWVSTDGTSVSFNYFCEVPTNSAPAFCPNEFQEHCYKLNLEELTESEARKVCQDECGDLVSIHSQQENTHLTGMFTNSDHTFQIRIGAQTDGIGRYWLDGSPFDFDNFGYFNAEVGRCSAMEQFVDIVGEGQWISNDCDQKIPFFCKRPKNVTSCGPTPTPTVAPNNPYMCKQSTQFYSGNGTILSPYYPLPFTPVLGPCTYVITVPHGSIAQIKFSDDSFISKSRMYFFSELADGEPVFEFSQYAPAFPINSTTNVLKMIFFLVSESFNQEEQWMANYGTGFS